MTDWRVYKGTGEATGDIPEFPDPPPWRVFGGGPALDIPELDPPRQSSGESRADWRKAVDDRIAASYLPDDDAVRVVNAALCLRRPVLITGKPGSGKSSLAASVARELRLGPLLRWPITSRSTLADGLYAYDAIGRLQDVNFREASSDPIDDIQRIGDYIRLGPLGTALLPYKRPRVLLLDEIDKGDIDLPNDLLNIFEYPSYSLPELARIADRTPEVSVLTADDGVRATVTQGRVLCNEFPLIFMTSNGEREFPPAFLRRCLRLNLSDPGPDELAAIVKSHLGEAASERAEELIGTFINRRGRGDLAVDQLLNAVHLTAFASQESRPDRDQLVSLLLQHLNQAF